MPDEDIYNRQQALPIRQFNCVAVVGCGGVGSWVALFEAMIGTKKIYIADGDLLEASNLNRLPFQVRMVGVRKTEVLSKWVKEHIIGARTDCKVICLPRLDVDTIDVLNDAEAVFDCTDRVEIQRVICSWCKDKKKPYFHAGYNGFHITITNDSTDVWGEGGGYTITPSFVASTTMVASMVVYMAHTSGYGKIDFSTEIGKIFEPIPEPVEEKIILVPRRGGRKKVHQDAFNAILRENQGVVVESTPRTEPVVTELAGDGINPNPPTYQIDDLGLGALFDAPHVEPDDLDNDDDNNDGDDSEPEDI